MDACYVWLTIVIICLLITISVYGITMITPYNFNNKKNEIKYFHAPRRTVCPTYTAKYSYCCNRLLQIGIIV